MYKDYFKRPMDFIFSLLALIVLSPIFIIIAILVKMKLGSPIIFSQERPGKDGRTFRMYKFRTMTDERDEKGDFLPDNMRLTQFGKTLRSTSLDELPELWNIIRGDMSLVGPRPLLVEYLHLYDSRQKRRHEVRPGLTGLAQTSGRNAISWDEKFNLDIIYVDNISFFKDIKYILITVKKVFFREGVSSETSQTMEPFMGNKRKDVD